MVDRESVTPHVVHILDVLSPLDLEKLNANQVEAFKINFTTGFDSSMKKALCIPFSKIARKLGKDTSRVISQSETAALKTAKGAIDLTTAAANGESFDGE